MEEVTKPLKTVKRPQPAKKWYAIYTRSRAEKKVYEQLLLENIEAFFPTVVRLKQWTDRKKKVVEPLLRSYVFVHIFIEQQRFKVLESPHAVRLVCFEGAPVAIPDEQIGFLKILSNQHLDIETTRDTFKLGQNVCVKAGALLGLKGQLVEYRGTKKVVVKIDHLNQVLLVTIDSAMLE